LIALVGIRMALPPAIGIHLRILGIHLGPTSGPGGTSPWLILAWVLSLALTLAGAWPGGGLPLVLPRPEIQRRLDGRLLGPGRAGRWLVDFLHPACPLMEPPRPLGRAGDCPVPAGIWSLLGW